MTAFFWIGILAAIGCTVMVAILCVGAVNSRIEEEYWAEYWQDTPTLDNRCVNPATESTVLKRAA